MKPGFELDHIGIATRSIEESLRFYRSMGWKKFSSETVPSENVKVAFVEFDNQVNIELLEPLTEDSTIAKFMRKRSPGIHHICYRVPDIEAAISKLKADGIRLIDEKARPGAHGCRVAFIHPSAAGGVLVELSQRSE